jgi:hypothetical protein
VQARAVYEAVASREPLAIGPGPPSNEVYRSWHAMRLAPNAALLPADGLYTAARIDAEV